MAILADNWGHEAVWTKLSRYHHAPHVPAIFKAVLERSRDRHLPFMLWARFASILGVEGTPKRQRTYHGLCLSDKEEIACLRSENEYAIQEWQQVQPAIDLAPTFFLAHLDLSSIGFGDQHIALLRPVAPLLISLRLDRTHVTDDGVIWIARATSNDDAYRRLELLSLKALAKVTDTSLRRLSNLNLRMLGELAFQKLPCPLY